MSIKFITDSGSDILAPYDSRLNVLPLTVRFDDDEYKDGATITHHEFYEKLIESDTLPKTSQVTPYIFEEAISEARSDGSDVLIITISSKLSGTYQSACIAAAEFDEGVYVVDSENVSVGEKALVTYAMQLADSGMQCADIADELNSRKQSLHTLALLDTLEYLKKGGRISKTVALAGSLLSIKPVVTVREGEVAILGKARGSKQGNNFLIEQVKSFGIDFTKPVFLGYTGLSDVMLKKYINDSKDIWEGHADILKTGTIGGAIGTHVGPGAIAVAFFADI